MVPANRNLVSGEDQAQILLVSAKPANRGNFRRLPIADPRHGRHRSIINQTPRSREESVDSRQSPAAYRRYSSIFVAIRRLARPSSYAVNVKVGRFRTIRSSVTSVTSVTYVTCVTPTSSSQLRTSSFQFAVNVKNLVFAWLCKDHRKLT